ncbi:MAG: FtsX-like permease family protein [Eubacteriaceae bacterium]
MSFTKIAIRNILMNFKKYIMYLFSVAFSVFTFYTFISLSYTKEVVKAAGDSSKIDVMLRSFAVIIAVFIVFFLWYSNKNFLKSRKKEIATYALFGMPYSRIGRLVLIENTIIGVIALIIGIGFGILFSKLLTMALLSLLGEFLLIEPIFIIEKTAIIQTIGIFIGIFLLIGLHSYLLVYRFKIIELFSAEKVGEQRMNGSYPLLLVSILMIGGGYYLASSDNAYKIVNNFFPILFLTICGTFLLFIKGLPIIIKSITKHTDSYYKTTNLLSLSSFLYKTRSNAVLMSTIAVLSAVAMTAVAITYSMYFLSSNASYNNSKYDLCYEIKDESIDSKVNEIFFKNNNDIKYDVKFDIVTSMISTETINVNDKDYFNEPTKVQVISLSDFNSLLKKQPVSDIKINISSNMDAVYLYAYMPDKMEKHLENDNEFNINNSSVKLNIIDAIHDNIMPNIKGCLGTLVVSDSQFNNLLNNNLLSRDTRYRGIMYEDAGTDKNVFEELSVLLEDYSPSFYYAYYASYLKLFGMVLFIGIFMGVVFLLSTASLLYFKQMSDAESDKNYFATLKNIGLDENTEKKVIAKQILPVFLLPLLVGTLHSAFAMKAASAMLLNLNLFVPATMMFILYSIIYSVFYLITLKQYQRVVG